MLLDQSLKKFLDDLAAGTPTPAAGSTSALSGAMAAGLGEMVCRVTLANERHTASWDKLREPLQRLEALRAELGELMEEDILAYKAFADALKLPRESAVMQEARKAAIQSELQRSTRIPLQIARKCRKVLEEMPPVAGYGVPMAVADVGTAVYHAEAGRLGALFSVKANLSLMKEAEFIRWAEREADEIGQGMEELRLRVLLLVESRMA